MNDKAKSTLVSELIELMDNSVEGHMKRTNI